MARPKQRSLDIGFYKGIMLLLLINFAIFFYSFEWAEFKDDPLNLELNEDIRDEYGYTPDDILNGEKLYTIFTHMFFHDDLLHFLGNIAALFLMGCMIEKRLGTKRFFLLYVLCGLAGVGLSCAMYPGYGENSDDASIIGASAAVYGIVAAACIWRPKAKITWPLTSFIAALIIYPFAVLFKHMIPRISDSLGTHLSDVAVNRAIFVITVVFVLFVLYVLFKTVKVKTWVFALVFIMYSIASVQLYEGDLPLISLISLLAGFITGLVLYPIIAKIEKRKRKISTV